MTEERKKFVVTCAERCWDGKKCRLYYPGDKDEVDPLDPLAKYFEGWPPGTEVYTKSKGKSGTRIVPGEGAVGIAKEETVNGSQKPPKKGGRKKAT